MGWLGAVPIQGKFYGGLALRQPERAEALKRMLDRHDPAAGVVEAEIR